MWNVGYLPAFYWDGRAATLEAQALGALAGGNMGVGKENMQKKADELGTLPEYKPLFAEAFPGEGATPETIAQALSAYERTLFCGDTAYDRYVSGDTGALTAEQKQGFEVFASADKGNCASCHTPPFFSDAYKSQDGAYHNTGIGFKGKKPEEVDVGRKAISKNDSEHGSFKTPTLRNVRKSPPYFHDGSVATLEEAVQFMASGGHPNPNLDEKLAKMAKRSLGPEDIKALVAFLGALDCEGELKAPID
jgi:cytochrome c peroxidase